MIQNGYQSPLISAYSPKRQPITKPQAFPSSPRSPTTVQSKRLVFEPGERACINGAFANRWQKGPGKDFIKGQIDMVKFGGNQNNVVTNPSNNLALQQQNYSAITQNTNSGGANSVMRTQPATSLGLHSSFNNSQPLINQSNENMNWTDSPSPSSMARTFHNKVFNQGQGQAQMSNTMPTRGSNAGIFSPQKRNSYATDIQHEQTPAALQTANMLAPPRLSMGGKINSPRQSPRNNTSAGANRRHSSNEYRSFDHVSVADQHPIITGCVKTTGFSSSVRQTANSSVRDTPKQSQCFDRTQGYSLRTGLDSSRGSSAAQGNNNNNSRNHQQNNQLPTANASTRINAAISAMKNYRTDFVSRSELRTAESFSSSFYQKNFKCRNLGNIQTIHTPKQYDMVMWKGLPNNSTNINSLGTTKYKAGVMIGSGEPIKAVGDQRDQFSGKNLAQITMENNIKKNQFKAKFRDQHLKILHGPPDNFIDRRVNHSQGHAMQVGKQHLKNPVDMATRMHKNSPVQEYRVPVPPNLVMLQKMNPISGVVDSRNIRSHHKRLKTISCFLEDSHIQARHQNKQFEKGMNDQKFRSHNHAISRASNNQSAQQERSSSRGSNQSRGSPVVPSQYGHKMTDVSYINNNKTGNELILRTQNSRRATDTRQRLPSPIFK